jgi:hypothetical protein
MENDGGTLVTATVLSSILIPIDGQLMGSHHIVINFSLKKISNNLYIVLKLNNCSILLSHLRGEPSVTFSRSTFTSILT